MLEELVSILAFGVAAAALFVPRTGSARDSMRTMTRNLPGHAGDALLRSGTSQPESAAEQADAGRAAEQDTHDVPGPRGGGDSYDPRPLEDKTRRSIAYKLIALLAFLVIALLAMVGFGVITVGELKEFDLFLAPLVALVTGATAYYFTRKRT